VSTASAEAGALRAIIAEAIACEALDARALDRILRRHPKAGRGFYSKREVLAAFRADPAAWPLGEAAFAEKLRTTPTRTLSGVAPLAVLTKPFPCPGRCVFCPSDVRMPKSYLASEPGCQRAQANRFDPYLQAWNRLAAFRAMGHSTAKVELIVLGGTWSFYPESYQVWFATRLFDALNDFGAGVDRRGEVGAFAPDFSGLALGERGYDASVAAHLRAAEPGGELIPLRERGDWRALEAAQRANEAAGARCVGLALETRPDHVTQDEVLRLRRLGATKVQLGIQSLDDAVLAANRRGHGVAATRRAIELLRGAGFKIHAHWMANLLGSTPDRDRADFARLFDDPAIRPDELKLYPCSLVETAELAQHHARGEWRAYERDELLPLVADCLAAIPRWCRATRVIRDIPSHEIVAGSRETNLREAAEAQLRERGVALNEMRAREVRGARIEGELALRETRYATSLGDEIFLEALTDTDRLAGFARITLPNAAAADSPPIDELRGAALLREVHVYGAVADLGEHTPNKSQHAGLGSRLIQRATEIARAAHYPQLSVISAIGTRAWYRRHRFTDGALYQHLALQAERSAA